MGRQARRLWTRSPMNEPPDLVFFTDRDLGRQFPSVLRAAGVPGCPHPIFATRAQRADGVRYAALRTRRQTHDDRGCGNVSEVARENWSNGGQRARSTHCQNQARWGSPSASPIGPHPRRKKVTISAGETGCRVSRRAATTTQRHPIARDSRDLLAAGVVRPETPASEPGVLGRDPRAQTASFCVALR